MVRNMCLRESIKQTISFGSRFLIQTKRETAFKEPQKIERQGQDSNDFSFYRSTVEYSARFCGANWRRSFAAFLPCGIATGGGEMHRHSCLQQKNDSANATFMLCSLHLLHYMGLLPEVVEPPIHPPSHSPIHAFNQSMIDSLVHPIHFFKRSPMHQIFFSFVPEWCENMRNHWCIIFHKYRTTIGFAECWGPVGGPCLAHAAVLGTSTSWISSFHGNLIPDWVGDAKHPDMWMGLVGDFVESCRWWMQITLILTLSVRLHVCRQPN